MSRTVCVVGSIRMDLSVSVDALPQLGDTRFGEDLQLAPGGAGVVQAITTARLGARARLLGCIGDDDWASELRTAFATDGIDTSGVSTTGERATGAALISRVEGEGEAILISPGANAAFTAEQVDAQALAIEESDTLLLQLGVSLEAAERAIHLASSVGKRVVLHASPYRELPSGWLDRIDVLVVDETGGRRLAGCDSDEVEAIGVARRLQPKIAGRVVVILDEGGAVSFDGEKKVRCDALHLERVDEAAAADAFAAALALALAEEQRTSAALRFASAAYAIAASRPGTLDALPTRDEVQSLLEKENETGGTTSAVHSPA